MAAAKPQLTRVAALTAITVAISALATACGGAETLAKPPPSANHGAVSPDDVRFVHQTFHRLPRFCGDGRTERDRLDTTTTRFIELYHRYPADRFRTRIDDESGTMLSAILVLRDELSRCGPRHAARIDPILPAQVRRALRDLPSGRRSPASDGDRPVKWMDINRRQRPAHRVVAALSRR